MDSVAGSDGGAVDYSTEIERGVSDAVSLVEALEAGGLGVGEVRIFRLTDGVFTLEVRFHGEEVSEPLEFTQ